MHTQIKIERFSISNKNMLATKWQMLERDSIPNVFLSWFWVGSWLDLVTDNVFLIEACRGEKTVGLCLFVERTRTVLGCFQVKQWWLHRTGRQKQDQIWIEYNDFLLDESCADSVREEMISAVANFEPSVKEVIIGLSDADKFDSYSAPLKKRGFVESTTVLTSGYLTLLPRTIDEFSQNILSKNTRSQITRSTKIIKGQGELKFEVFTSPEKLLELFPKIASIHIDKWKVTKEGSGFENPLFESFIKSSFTQNSNKLIQVCVLTLDEIDLGYLINFVHKNKVYFYLSALTEYQDNKVKIGLSLHAEAIKYYISQGFESYDFLGGDARYKSSLSNNKYDLEMKCYYRNDFFLRLENKLKKFKRKFLHL